MWIWESSADDRDSRGIEWRWRSDVQGWNPGAHHDKEPGEKAPVKEPEREWWSREKKPGNVVPGSQGAV